MTDVEWKEQRGAGNQLQLVSQYGELGLRLASMEEGGLGWGVSVMGGNWEIGFQVATRQQAERAAVIAAGSAMTFIAGVMAQVGRTPDSTAEALANHKRQRAAAADSEN